MELRRDAAELKGFAEDDARYSSKRAARSISEAIAAQRKVESYLEQHLGPRDSLLPIVRSNIRHLESLR